MTTTDTAQRRLLEALAHLHDRGDGHDLDAFASGLRAMAGAAPDETLPGVSGLYTSLADLAEAVRTDLTTKETSS